jgi:hypothetical protein
MMGLVTLTSVGRLADRSSGGCELEALDGAPEQP